MVELIFVIVIIGILTAIALPRLAATRDDAKLSNDVASMGICITDAAAFYTARGTDLEAGDSEACDSIKCYDFNFSTNGDDFNVTTDSAGDNYCGDINQVGGHLVNNYKFKGTRIVLP